MIGAPGNIAGGFSFAILTFPRKLVDRRYRLGLAESMRYKAGTTAKLYL